MSSPNRSCMRQMPARKACLHTKASLSSQGLRPCFSSRTPHVAQSPLRFECKVESEIPFGSEGPGGASLVIASVTTAYVAKAMYRGKGQLDIAALRLIGRSSVDQYLIADGQFTIAQPNTGEAVV
jgi:flavin reductase (DIM6/NTAB) family NADH-FMN oxidoreductase RutF